MLEFAISLFENSESAKPFEPKDFGTVGSQNIANEGSRVGGRGCES
jgi:hypothetical protein